MRRLLPVLGLVLAGCLGLPASMGPTNTCEADADCVSGQCNVELGMCVSGAREEALRIAFRVNAEGAPFGVTPLPVDFMPMDIDEPGSRNFELPVPVLVSGHVRDSVTDESISSQVLLRAQSPIPGRAPIVIDPSVSATVNDGSYTTNLMTTVLPDTDYTVEVRPNGEAASALPPWRPVQPWRSPEPGEFARLPDLLVTYPERCGDTQTTDCLASIEGVVVDEGDLPQDGFIVTAIETATGRVISSTATTGDGDMEPGHFVAVLDVRYVTAPDTWFFRIVPSVERSEAVGPRPTWTVEAVNLFGEGLVRIRTPRVEGTVLYEGFVETEDGLPVADAQLALETRDVVDPTSNVVGVFRTTATTDEEGRFSVELLPATYDVVVVPPSREASAELAVLRESVDLTTAGERVSGQAFQLPARQVLGGTVVAAGMLQMSGAQVVANARPSAPTELGDIARHARSAETMTGTAGRFRLPVDVGVYDITVLPPPGSNFPWHVRSIEVGGADSALENRYDIDNPMTLTGEVAFVEGDDRTVAVGGTIEAYAVVDDGEGGERTVLVGRAEIDEEGRYTLLLPPSI